MGHKAARTFKKLGINLADSSGNLRDQFDVLDDLREKLAGFGQKQQIAIMESIFGKIPLAAASKLLSDAGSSVRGLRSELEKAGGSSKRTAAFIRDDVKGSIDGLNSAIEGVKISIFSLNEGPLKDAIDGMTNWVRTNEGFIASKIGGFLLLLFNNFDKIADAIGKIAKGIAVFFVLSAALKGIAVIIGIINLLMVANPIALGIMAAVAAVALLSGALDPVIDMLKTIGTGISGAISAVGSITGIFGGDGEEEKQRGAQSKIVSPQDRIARSIDEQRTTSTSEVTIKDDTGRAEVTNGKLGTGLTLQPTGGF